MTILPFVYSDLPVMGKKMADALKPGVPLLLYGPMGVGKTTLARYIVSSLLTVAQDIPSPSFPILLCYETRRGPLWHADLYRLETPAEWGSLDLDTVMANALCIVEWPERIPKEAMPKKAWSVILGFASPADASPDGTHQETRHIAGIDSVWCTPGAC